MEFDKKFDDFDPGKKVDFLVANRDLWKAMREQQDDLISLGFCKIIPREQFDLAVDAIQTILSEYVINEKEYAKYKAVKSLSALPFKSLIKQKKDILKDPSPQKEQKYVDDSRAILWGFMNASISPITSLYLEIGHKIYNNDKHIYDSLSKDDHKILISCVLAVAIECIIRNKELKNLEQQYYGD